MRQMNLGAKPRWNKYPALREFKGTWMLSLAEDAHVFRRGEQFVCTEDIEGRHILAKSTNNLSTLLQTLKEAQVGKWFGGAYNYIPSCLVLSYLEEVAGDREELWHMLTSADAYVIENLFYKLGCSVNVSVALSGAKPINEWRWKTQRPGANVSLSIVPDGKDIVAAHLRFTDISVEVDICNSKGEPSTFFIAFPTYNSIADIMLSRRDYYILMWKRLWRDMLAVVGLRCADHFISLSPDVVECTHAFSIYAKGCFNMGPRVTCARDIDAAIEEYLL